MWSLSQFHFLLILSWTWLKWQWVIKSDVNSSESVDWFNPIIQVWTKNVWFTTKNQHIVICSQMTLQCFTCSHREPCSRKMFICVWQFLVFLITFSSDCELKTQLNYIFSCRSAVDSAAATCRCLWLAVQKNLWLLMQGKISMWGFIQRNQKTPSLWLRCPKLVWSTKCWNE